MSESAENQPLPKGCSSNWCLKHRIELVTGCVGCVKFFCPVCLSDASLIVECPSSQSLHIFTTVAELLKMFKSDLENNLKCIQKNCDILEEEGRTVLEEFDEQKKQVDSALDAERSKIVTHLEEVRSKAKKASQDTEEILKSDDVTLFQESALPTVLMPRIILQQSGLINSVTAIDPIGSQGNRSKLRELKTLKYASRMSCTAVESSAWYDNVFILSHHRTSGGSSYYKISQYQLEDGKLIERRTIAQTSTFSEEVLSPTICCSASNADYVVYSFLKPSTRVIIKTIKTGARQEITKGWVKDMITATSQDKCLVVVLRKSIKILSSSNAPEFVLRCEYENSEEYTDEVKQFHISESHFCVLDGKYLYSYKWNQKLDTCRETWKVDFENRGATSGCYVKDLDLIMIMVKTEAVFINTLNGSQCGKINVNVFGIDSKVDHLSAANEHLIFGVIIEGKMNFISYELEMEEAEKGLPEAVPTEQTTTQN